ncbi:phosphonate C-P lyase system protein PhnG [Mesorhizobium sp. VK25A]|uniref:Phosphonate C-P lyase system protein PhnG n=1 Tax=Mesorhizobium vachelliae TaxID=3072309 RepID=A0ABU5A2I5_9HYPH|nr:MULTISPECIES: phosphonate C-P lyase system protein PhnG [unclassified Mesorhizobium]MDX8531903.1 phosphonate C-P lyase system protein PhnG [Mesorhizobium sp. VK25D]MDX8543654.1 phosphonate C-P lyase system protein PhnG [Mesorhizobium sp. VK25A]
MTREARDQGIASHAFVLDTLARSDVGALKHLAELLLPEIGSIEVVSSRTGLVMLPFIDTVLNTAFHLGEVLVAEAHIRLGDHDGLDGYGAVTGRDLEQAMAMAIVDAALAAGIQAARIGDFLSAQAARQAEEDTALLRKVEATRVKMETF